MKVVVTTPDGFEVTHEAPKLIFGTGDACVDVFIVSEVKDDKHYTLGMYRYWTSVEVIYD